jgi:hypothetical protein
VIVVEGRTRRRGVEVLVLIVDEDVEVENVCCCLNSDEAGAGVRWDVGDRWVVMR